MKPQLDLTVLKTPNRQILTTGRTWEIDETLPLDSVEPDFLGFKMKDSLSVLLDESSNRGVALDWETVKVHVSPHPKSGTALLITRVSVL